MADLVTIRMQLIGARAVAAEARTASGAIAGTGVAAAGAGSALGRGAKESTAFTNGLKSIGRYARFAAGTLGIGAVVYEGINLVNTFREAAKVTKQTEAVIASTGGAANVTAKQVTELAEALSLKTRMDDEEIQAAANVLLTSKNIRNEVGKGNDVFDQATESVLDLASAMHVDTLAASKQLGKALNDPIYGMTALRRANVDFTESEREKITTLVESGNILRAQKMILREVRSETEGSARAQHDVWDQLAVTWENLEEKLGKLLAPALKDAARWLGRFINQAIKGRGSGGKFVDTLKDVWDAVKDVVGVLKDVVNWIGNTGREINDKLKPIESFSESWGTLKESMLKVKPGFEAVHGVLKATWDVFSGIAGAMGDVIDKIGDLLDAFANLPGPLRSLLGLDPSTYVVPLNPDHTNYGGGPDIGDRGPNAGKDPQRRRAQLRGLMAPSVEPMGTLALDGGSGGVVHAHFHVDGRELAEVTAGWGENDRGRGR